MLIKINDSWQLRTDSENYILEERVGTRMDRNGRGSVGVPNWKTKGYFRSPWKALRRMIALRIRTHQGNYPPSALEPLYTFLHEIEIDIATFEKRIGACGATEISPAKAKGGLSPSLGTKRTGKASQHRLAPQESACDGSG